MKNPGKKTLQNKCDALLTPIIKAMFPRCLLCGSDTQVAHHHVHKSKSLRLRYEIMNLINLCNSCHCALHLNESYYASKIVLIKGIEWFQEIERIKNQIVKADILFYKNQLFRLQRILEETKM